jgi:hypothetical protein
MTIGKGFPPIEALTGWWPSAGHDLVIVQRDRNGAPQALMLVGKPIEAGANLDDVRAQLEDMAATLRLADKIRQQSNKALFFANAVVRGLFERAADATIPGPQREHLSALLDAARLVVENLGGGESGVNPPPSSTGPTG